MKEAIINALVLAGVCALFGVVAYFCLLITACESGRDIWLVTCTLRP